jgi:phosphatidylserine decarboxylase
MIQYVDRKSGVLCTEKVYGEKTLELLYGDGWASRLFSLTLLPLIAHLPFCSQMYGYVQKRAGSRGKIAPFIREYGINESEFAKRQFDSFNDFFIRKLRPECRPIERDEDRLAMPADGRYLVFEKFNRFFVKGQEFFLSDFLQDSAMARRYSDGSMMIARLCPVDYHRFHFPCEGTALSARLIKGPLYSVNPIALKRRVKILSENKRMVTELESERFGHILYVEVGATSVGSIQQTYVPGRVRKGEEKGYFEFGGSCIVLLFEKGRVRFDEDLVRNTEKGLETLCRFGEGFGGD